MWIESSFDVGGRRVGVSIKRLDGRDGDRLSAEMAWFAQGLLTPGVDLEAIGWPAFLQQLLSEYVAITVDDDTLEKLETLWTQVVCRALETFMHVNRLDPALKQYLRMEPTCVS
jgi:hypothetical protein